jgi:hypothetical protein
MKIPAFQHLIAAILLSLLIAGSPFLFRPLNTESITLNVLYFSAFSLTGIFWMFFEGKIPPKTSLKWVIKLFRGIFVWGILLDLLIWHLSLLFNIRFAEGLDFAVILVFIFSSVMGFFLAIVLSIYSFFFIKT